MVVLKMYIFFIIYIFLIKEKEENIFYVNIRLCLFTNVLFTNSEIIYTSITLLLAYMCIVYFNRKINRAYVTKYFYLNNVLLYAIYCN